MIRCSDALSRVDNPRNDNEKRLKRQLLQRHKYFQFIFATAAAHELCHTFVGYINRGGYFGHLGTPPEASHLDYGFEPNQTQRSRGMRARGESGRYIEGILYGGSVEYFYDEREGEGQVSLVWCFYTTHSAHPPLTLRYRQEYPIF
jgi:hypothetical protein